jgi:hypothetical protein
VSKHGIVCGIGAGVQWTTVTDASVEVTSSGLFFSQEA